MFDNIVVFRNSQSGPPINTGMLAEALLFYGNVHLLLNRGTLSSLLSDLGADGVDRLLERPEVRVSYLTQNFGTLGSTVGALRSYGFGIFEVGGTKKRRLSKSEELEQIVERTLGDSAATRRRIKRLVSSMSFPRVEDDMSANQLTESAKSDLNDEAFVHEAIRQALSALLPNYALPRNWHFRILKLNDGSFAIDTNLNFQLLNAEYHKITPPEHSSITPDYLVNFIYDSHIGGYLASKYSAEFVHDPLCSSIMKLKYVNLFRRRERSIKEIDLFQNLHLNAHDISGALNAKERTFEEFLKLLDQADRFKKWLRETNPDENLLKEYFRAVTHQTWVDRLPTRGMRWVITSGLAAAVEAFYPTGGAMMAAQGISLVDATVLDRILKGWKPDQFVRGPMSNFLGTSEQ
jgi:hypothetical protein